MGPRIPRGARELEALAQITRREGLLVSARCYAVSRRRGQRFEIVLEGQGERAVVDIAVPDTSQLGDRIAEAVDAFAAAMLLRLRGPEN